MKKLIIACLLAGISFAQTRTSATKEGTNIFTGQNSWSGSIMCSGTCIAKMFALVDADDTYVSQFTLLVTPTLPDATNSLTRALRVKATLNPSTNDPDMDVDAIFAHTKTAGSRDMFSVNTLFGYAEHNGTGTISFAYGTKGYAINTSTGTIANAIGVGGVAQAIVAGGAITDAHALEAHVLPGPATITNGSGLYIKTPYLLTGSCTNCYGIYLEDQNVGTNKYAIYTNAGAVRFGDTVQIGAAGTPIGSVYSASASLDFDLSGAGITQQDLTITVTGAAVGDVVSLGLPTALQASGIQCSGFVSTSNTVTVRCVDVTSSNPNPAAATVRAQVNHF
jgi:hypothetical protein